MTRSFPLVLALAVVLGACDTQAPAPSATVAAAPTAMISAKGDVAHEITDRVSVAVDGETVLLRIEGQTFALGAGEAYLVGQVVSRVGFEALPEKLAASFGGGDRCEPPPPGAAARRAGERYFGGKCPPPPPPPIFDTVKFQRELLGSTVEVVEVPKGLDWQFVPGGFTAPF